MNFLVLDAPAITTEPQVSRNYTIFTLDGTMKTDASLSAQHIFATLIAGEFINFVFYFNVHIYWPRMFEAQFRSVFEVLLQL
jgi:hypothetical protein